MKSIGNIRRNHAQTGFSMVEVIVASLIFSLAAAGIFATVSSLNQPSQDSDEEVRAVFIGKQVLESLRTAVSANTWDTGPLAIGDTYTGNSIIVDGISYDWVYAVEADPYGTGARKVILNVTW